MMYPNSISYLYERVCKNIIDYFYQRQWSVFGVKLEIILMLIFKVSTYFPKLLNCVYQFGFIQEEEEKKKSFVWFGFLAYQPLYFFNTKYAS